MAENIIIDKVIGESGASNSNAIGQSEIVESKVKKGRKKRSRAWDHFSRKTDSDGSEKGVCNYCKKEYFVDTKEHVDNAGSNSVAITELSKQLTKWGTNLMGGSHLHIRCMAHIVNLIVQDGTKEANVSIERVRQAVKYIRQSPARWKKFQECCKDENLTKKFLCLDVPTRWNSTYMMLSRVIEYEGAIVEYADRDIGLALHLKFVDIMDKNSTCTLLSSDWEEISGSRYVTSNLHFLEICQVGVYLNQLISNGDHVLAKMTENMKERFDKFWGDTEKMNKIVFIPCVLDPRHKFSTLSFALKKMFGEKGAALEIGV
ncbi:hypothetical protein KY284_000851 [Solanum tuberosum]|nr:hypothetical protein KY284_000851 [Solanum tuberosum]